MELRGLPGMVSIIDTARLVELGSKKGGCHTHTGLKMSNDLLIHYTGKKHSGAELTSSQGGVILRKFTFFSPIFYLFGYMFKSNNANLDDTDCTWKARHVNGMFS